MSTKIYTGFKLSISELSKLQSEIDLLREKLKPVSINIFTSMICNRLIYEYDKKSINNSSSFDTKLMLDDNILYLSTPMSDVDIPLLKKDYTRYDLIRYIRDSHHFIEQHGKIFKVISQDPTLTIAFFPTNNDVLGIHYTDISDYITYIKEMNTFEDYHYQDSTDRPSNITEEEWEQRRNDWDQVLLSKSFSSTTDIALTANIITLDMLVLEFFHLFSGKEKINIDHIDGIKTKEQRAKKLSFEILIQEEAKRSNLKKPSSILRLFSETKEALASDDNNSTKDVYQKTLKKVNNIIVDGSNSEIIEKIITK